MHTHDFYFQPYLLVLQICRELITLGERARAFDGLFLGLLAEDGLRVLEFGPPWTLRTGLGVLAVP